MVIMNVKCSDGVVVEVESMVASKMSLALRRRLDESGSSGIVLENVNSRSLTKVLEYCTVHCTPPPGTTEADLKVWDSKFVKVEPSILCELASAAYHLEIKPIVDLTCYAIAQLLKGAVLRTCA
jgi:S-phase kinase-associated protein 1